MPTNPDDLPIERDAKRRSRSGCLTCRQTRIKCDEVHPICGRCRDRRLSCDWPGPTRSKGPTRSIKQCDVCRSRRLRCVGEKGRPCDSCLSQNVQCVWSDYQRSPSPIMHQSTSQTAPPGPQPMDFHFPSSDLSPFPQTSQPRLEPRDPGSQLSSNSPLLLHKITGIDSEEVKTWVKKYFSSVHFFGYAAFIHEADYWDRYEQGRAPSDLTLLMAAHAIRFGGGAVGSHQLEIADRWVSEVGERLLTVVMKEYGAVQLMEMVLCQTYDFLNGRYSRGFVMAGMAARMMTFLRLHTLDESPLPSPRPLLRPESLRRLAWSVWWLDATIDGGNSGFSAIRHDALTIQLPCDERHFLLNIPVITQPLSPPETGSSTSLGFGARLLRAMNARQILADTHSRISRRLLKPDAIEQVVRGAINEACSLLEPLPSDMVYSRAQYLVHKDQLPAMVIFHVMRNTCYRHISLLEILAASDLTDGAQNVPIKRQALIQGALELSGIFKDATDHTIPLDPQLAMHAYNGIETLLFQPLRQVMDKTPLGLFRDEAVTALRPLIKVVRELAVVCKLVALVYPEAINRMIQFGYVDDLTQDDMLAVLHKVHSLANAGTEFDFQDSFWRYELSLARRQAAAGQDPGQEGTSPNDDLLELPAGVDLTLSSNNTQNTMVQLHSEDLSADTSTQLQTFLAKAKRSGYNTPAIACGDSSPRLQQPLPLFSYDDIQTMLNGHSTVVSGEDNGFGSATQSASMSTQIPFQLSFWDGRGNI